MVMPLKDFTGKRFGELTAVARVKNLGRGNAMVTFRGETATLAEWSRRLGLGYSKLKCRRAAGWSVERMLTCP